ncbi:MAG: vWA domain-containing protein [Brevinematales bacterium]
MVFGKFSHAWWLVGISLLVLGLFLVVEWKKERWRKQQYSPEQRNVLFGREFTWNRFVKSLFLALSVLFFSFALLDPRWGMVNRTERIEGVDIILVADLSQSMLCDDIGESRLERLQRIVFDLMAKGGNHRIGLVFFAAQAYPVVPLTFDYEVISLWLQEANPLAIENQGSNLEDALRKAMELFEKNTLSHRLIVVLSDGEDMEHSPASVASQVAQKGIQIVSIGIGTVRGGKIPLSHEKGKPPAFLTVDGKEVITRLRPDILKEIARKTGGVFLDGTDNAGEKLVSYVEKIKKNPYGKVSYETMRAQYQYFLVPALLLWLLALLWPMRKEISMLILVGFFLYLRPSEGFTSEASRGTRLYRQGRYQEAKEAFQRALVKKPDSVFLRYNLGNTLYFLEEWDKASREFSGLTNSASKDVKIRSLYNMGTTLAASGEKKEAALVYRQLLEKISPGNPLYRKTIENLLYLQQIQSNQSSSSQSQDKPSPSPQHQKEKKKNQPSQQTPPEEDAQSLLNLVQQEERKNIQKLPLGGGNPQSRYPW